MVTIVRFFVFILTVGVASVMSGVRADPAAVQIVGIRCGAHIQRDVAPILLEHCAPCHRPNRAAPFQLLTLADARRHATEIVNAIESRRMPPWLPRHGVVALAGERRLSDVQIETIERWVSQGISEGNPADMPPLPLSRDGWQLGNPIVIEMGDAYRLPVSGADLYRNFVLPTGITERKYVRAIESGRTLRPRSITPSSRLIGHDGRDIAMPRIPSLGTTGCSRDARRAPTAIFSPGRQDARRCPSPTIWPGYSIEALTWYCSST